MSRPLDSRGDSRSDARGRRARAEGPAPALGAGAALLGAVAASAGALSAWPIYEIPRVWLIAGLAWAAGIGIVWLGARLRWGALTLVALLAAFVLGIVPLAVPGALATGGPLPPALARGLGDALAAVALGWKQLLTLTLPVASYQATLVPYTVVVFAATAMLAWLALRGGRIAPFAAVPALAPVAFGVVFGASRVSEPLGLGPFSIPAPRELAAWVVVCVAGALWVAWSSGISRRAALRLGRRSTIDGDAASAGGRRRPRAIRAASALLAVLVAGGVGLAVVPLVDDERAVPRDRVDPELVVANQTSPLAGYRGWKRDAAFDAPVFSVSAPSGGELPGRLRMAVLDAYDGVDFFVSPGAAGLFTRFPSGDPGDRQTTVHLAFADAYDGIWLPISPPLAEPPRFSGPRADALADAFYVNRTTGAAIAVPEGAGVTAGDAFTASMGLSAEEELTSEPASADALIDLEAMPELAHWLAAQQLPGTAEGLSEAVERLRERGYLSHSLTDGEGERAWFDALEAQYGSTFVTSAGGHSIARIEQLFEQLNDQERAAGDTRDARALVAGIGDDEQFAAAAALLARAMGYDSRVVLGVRLGDAEEDGVPGVPACAEECTGANLAAWVEVSGADGAWIPIDASPQVEIPPSALDRGEQLPEFPTLPEEHDADEADPPAGATSDTNDRSDDPAEDALGALWPILRVVGLSLLALLLLALPICFLPVAKRIRRRRRRRAAADEVRALGAWDELVDGYADSGRRPRANAGRRDAADELGAPAGNRIAATVDRAVYAREGIDPGDVDELWRLVDEALAARRAELGWWGRLRSRFSLHSLIPGHRVWRSRMRAGRRRTVSGGSRMGRGAEHGTAH
ncbi:hypothetical protein MUN77_02435 [Leucobacter allii]|uniref:transglutaminase domain-containing protein n=1 Tax=Leucobacter allii TaxID=2932247 RepID=UPI001FD44D41|nr:transglutaminase domain-containing protein [Leucobacter allii]UOR02208.1 hypothetical protein MUN77_02435 [Leucobacter allii]